MVRVFWLIFSIILLFQEQNHAFSKSSSWFFSGSLNFGKKNRTPSTRGKQDRFQFGISTICKILHPSTNQIPESAESTHLKLASISCSLPEQSISESNRFNMSEFRSNSNNSLLAIAGRNKTKLEFLSIHLYGHNLTLDTTVSYIERDLDRNDNSTFQEYLTLWKNHKFITMRKSFDDDWKSLREDTKTPVQATIAQTISKTKLMISVYAQSLQRMKEFLKSNASMISGLPIEIYSFHSNRTMEENLSLLKNISIWFKQSFPYYYDECLLCSNREGNEYFGSQLSPAGEQEYLSNRTELFMCGRCNQISRFPRYNDMTKVLQTHRGRCGEYSVLVMLVLRALNYRCRYVVDRDDHAWAEVLVNGRWVHLDPCEAAVDEPLIYQNWGKNQTFILAVDQEEQTMIDVTHTYTTNHDAMNQRRRDEGFNSSAALAELLSNATSTLRELLPQSNER